MTNQMQLEILQKGVKGWNQWRIEHIFWISNLYGANLPGEDLSGADFSDTNLANADLSGANLSGAKLSGADLSSAKLLGATISEATLYGTKLTGAKLTGADLSRAKLSGANFSEADLSRADLSQAILWEVNLSQAKLSGANLSEADFSGADLFGADLSGANMQKAALFRTKLINLDLSAVKGLDSVVHTGRSSIGIDTISLSNGDIPEIFLRGAGVPDSFITYSKSLVGSAIEFYSCFISYSTKDQEFADRLYADLQAKGIRCWFAPHDIEGGRKIHEQIDEAIRLHDKLLLILSPSSMESEWVNTEIAKARKREVRDKARVLFPLRLAPFETLRDWECFDADTGKDSAREIREYFIPDFSTWKDHDSYQKAFARLVKDLQGKRESRASNIATSG